MKQQKFNVINVAALARRIGRSRSWFYQRLNGTTVSGKTATFSLEDRQRIAAALLEISAEAAGLAAEFDAKK